MFSLLDLFYRNGWNPDLIAYISVAILALVQVLLFRYLSKDERSE